MQKQAGSRQHLADRFHNMSSPAFFGNGTIFQDNVVFGGVFKLFNVFSGLS